MAFSAAPHDSIPPAEHLLTPHPFSQVSKIEDLSKERDRVRSLEEQVRSLEAEKAWAEKELGEAKQAAAAAGDVEEVEQTLVRVNKSLEDKQAVSGTARRGSSSQSPPLLPPLIADAQCARPGLPRAGSGPPAADSALPVRGAHAAAARAGAAAGSGRGHRWRCRERGLPDGQRRCCGGSERGWRGASCSV